MDCRIILPLLVASAVIGGLSDHIREDGDSFSPGFLLYFHGEPSTGSRATAYIKTNFSDPFEARLNFLCSDGSRNFDGQARIVNGSGVIEFEVPVNVWSCRVNFTGVMESSRQMFTTHEITIIYFRRPQKITFIETDKPLYKPGQEVKFRLLTIDSQFKTETSNIPQIQIESPSYTRLAQWRDVERPDGLVDLSFQLISEPALGEYKIKAYINNAWVTQSFQVDEYVLPKFEVTVNAPSFVLVSAQEYSFQVCAKYTYGQPVNGSVSGQVGKLHRDNYYGNRQWENPVLEGDGEEPDVALIDAVPFSGQLDSEGCLESSVSGLNLASLDKSFFSHLLTVRATVVEATTGDEVTEVHVDATQLATVQVVIVLESQESFKPGIPYQGRIKVTYPDGKPAPNETINITATVDGKTAYSANHTSDSEGIVEFEIPFAVVDKFISLQVEAEQYPYQHNPHGISIYSPNRVFILDPSYSPTGRYLQITPIFNSVNAGDKLTIQVLYTSDDDAVTSDLKVQFVSRNKLVDAEATQEGESCRRRVVVLDPTTPTPPLNFVTQETLTVPPRTQAPTIHVDPQALHEVNFTVSVSAGISPEAMLLMYYTSPEGEVVADSINLKINKAFENECCSETTLKVSAENGSLCGIGIVDKSVYVLGGENKITPEKSIFDWRACWRSYRFYRFRKRRSIYLPGFDNTVQYVDSSYAFSKGGLTVITNHDLWVAPCAYELITGPYSLGESKEWIPITGGSPTSKEDKIRSYFPSTWLWTLTRIGDGKIEIPLTVPHTITDWIANGICTNVEKGLGVSPPVVLRAFQPFFLSMSLPYSIICTEKTPIKVTVFNYLEQCLVVRVTLEENEGFALSGQDEYTVAVPAGEATTVTYKVAAFVLGSIPIQGCLLDLQFL